MTLPFSYAVCKKYIDEIVTVSDDEIFASMVILQEESKLAVGARCCCHFIAHIGPLKNKLKNKNVGLLMWVQILTINHTQICCLKVKVISIKINQFLKFVV